MRSPDKKIEELLENIGSRITEITTGETGMPVYLKETAFPEGSRGAPQSMITVSCLFLNEEGGVFADLFRSGTSGFMECVYGSSIKGLGKRGLEEISTALTEGRWYVSENPGEGKNKVRKKSQSKKVLNIPFRLSMMFRGA